MHCLTQLNPATPCKIVLPNADNIQPTQFVQLPLSSSLSASVKDAIILPKLKISSLMSLGQLCDDGCKIILDKKKLHVIKDNHAVLERQRIYQDGLLDTPIPKSYAMPPTHPGMHESRCNHM